MVSRLGFQVEDDSLASKFFPLLPKTMGEADFTM